MLGRLARVVFFKAKKKKKRKYIVVSVIASVFATDLIPFICGFKEKKHLESSLALSQQRESFHSLYEFIQ